MPLIRRIPKRGFNNARHATRYIPVNLEALNRFEDGARVDEAALRAVGLANGRNPIGIVIPCHRVIGSDGSLTGYGGGLDRKQFLLELEGALPALPALTGPTLF